MLKRTAFLPCPSLSCLGPTKLSKRLATRRRHTCAQVQTAPEQLPNARDIASASPLKIRAGKLFRGSTPACLPETPSKEAIEFLRSTATLVDLRSKDERRSDRQAVMARACGPDFDTRVRHIGLLNKRRVVWGLTRVLPACHVRDMVFQILANPLDARNGIVNRMDEGGLILLNRVLVEAGARSIGHAMNVVTDGVQEGKVYFYCSAGKDRTGLLAALVLKTIGVSEPDIIFDYTRSSETWENGPYDVRADYCCKYLFSRLRFFSSLGYDVMLTLLIYDFFAVAIPMTFHFLLARLEHAGLTPLNWIGAPPEVMEETLSFIKKRFGSVEDYLVHCGFEKRRMDELRRVMLPEG